MSARVAAEVVEVPSLTADERQLLGMIANGMARPVICQVLYVSRHTLCQRVFELRRRLGVQTDAQLVHRAHLLGLLAAAPIERRVVRPVPAPRPDPVPVPLPAPRVGALSPKPGATPDDARRLAARLEASFKGAQR